METTFFTFDFKFWDLIIVLLLLVVVIAVYVLFGKVSALKATVRSNSSSKINAPKTITEIDNSGSNNNEIITISNRLRKLEEQFSARTSTANTATIQAAPPVTPQIPIVEDEKPVVFDLSVSTPKVTEFYMSTPNPDGSFEADQGSDAFRNTVSLYKFTVSANNPLKATFVFSSDAVGTSDSLNNPKTFIEPVCYQANDAFPGASKVFTTTPGTAEKRNNKWVVVDKAKIKYQ